MGNGTSKSWRAIRKDDSWLIKDSAGNEIALIKKTKDAEAYARLISNSPYMLEALKAVESLIGDEDLPDNGELSGAAICDLVRSAVALATGNNG